jgi:hypothetical protein
MLIRADLRNKADDMYERWLREAGGTTDPDDPSEENLAKLFTITAMETSPEGKAKGLIDIVNMALALADKTLSSQVPVARCLVLELH